ncbi:hypothetical protein TNCV_2212861 [Trichonephila clavipes]|nr:hypothetical protein TNCV_2212861 [Trichonephila clavipes]
MMKIWKLPMREGKTILFFSMEGNVIAADFLTKWLGYTDGSRDLELEVNEDDIEELIMGHEDELTTELQEILTPQGAHLL